MVRLMLSMVLFFAACGGADMPPVTTGDAGTMTSTNTGTTPFMDPCLTNEECTTGLCFLFNQASVGRRCTRTCMIATEAADCPAPSTGCNGMGLCKHH